MLHHPSESEEVVANLSWDPTSTEACVSRLEPKRLALHDSGRATYGRRIQKRVYVRVLCMPPSRLLPIFSMGKFTVHKPVTVSCNTETLWCMDGCVESDFASQV